MAEQDSETDRYVEGQTVTWLGRSLTLRDSEAQVGLGETSWRESLPGFLTLAVLLAPALLAIWVIPWFVTQDGPAHVYNAQVLADSFDPHAPSREVYTISWKPIPNWMGHIVLAGLVSWLPAWVADRMMTSATLMGLAAATLWLRWRVAGGRGLVSAAFLCALLAMNFAWLMGFTSFLLGSCLFPITLGVWWGGRYRLSIARALGLSVLLCVGYFCHLVSLGLTVVGMCVLSLLGPIPSGNGGTWTFRIARLMRTAVSFIPLLGLGFFYLQAARRNGPLEPVWEGLLNPWSPGVWAERLRWADPITLAIKNGVPFTAYVSPGFPVFAPVLWLALSLVLWWYGRIFSRPRADVEHSLNHPDSRNTITELSARDDRQGWLLLAGLLIGLGILGPDSFGAAHGEFLPQRLVLLGLVALMPVFDVDRSRWSGRVLVGTLAAAVILQSAIVWDYGLYSDRTAGQIINARDTVGRRQRIVTLLVTSRSRFRANPLLHAEDWLGVDSDNVVWNNYEALHYYFPVQFRREIKRPHAGDLELVSIHEDKTTKASRLRDWEKILTDYADSIDVILFWKSDEELEAITKRWFELAERRGDVQIFRRIRPNHDNDRKVDPGQTIRGPSPGPTPINASARNHFCFFKVKRYDSSSTWAKSLGRSLPGSDTQRVSFSPSSL